MANSIRTAAGYETSQDYQKSSSLVAADVMEKIHANKAIMPTDEAFGLKDAVTSAIMLCMIAAHLTETLENEGVKVDLFEIIAESGKTIYARINEETRQTLLGKGFENYQVLMNAVATQEQIKNFRDAMYKLTTSYIVSSGTNTEQDILEKMMFVYCQQFDQLRQTLE